MTVTRLAAPKGMWSGTSSPLGVPDGKAASISNMLADYPGKLRMRGSLGSTVALASGFITQGVWVFGEVLLVSGAVTSDRYVTTTGAQGTVASPTDLRGRSARVGDYAFGPSTVNTDTLLRWDGTTTAPIAMTNAPVNAQDVARHQERLIVGGGSEPGTITPITQTSVWYTDPGGADANTLDDWKDDISGLVNQVVVGDDGDAIVALASMGRQLLVFKNNSIWTIAGDSPSTWSVRQLAGTLGCMDKMSVVVVDDVCFFVAKDGMPMLYDGATFTRLNGLEDRLHPNTATSAVCRAVRLPNDYVMVSYAETSGTTLQALLHLATQSWTLVEFDSTVVAQTSGNVTKVPWLVSTEQGVPFIIDEARKVRSLSRLTAGVPSGGDGTERNTANSADINIVPSITYRRQQLDLPLSKTVVKRVFVDSSLGSAAASWSVTLTSLLGALGSALSFAGSATVGPHRSTQDVNSEADDLSVTITLSAPADTPLLSAELYDVWIEHAAAQRR